MPEPELAKTLVKPEALLVPQLQQHVNQLPDLYQNQILRQ